MGKSVRTRHRRWKVGVRRDVIKRVLSAWGIFLHSWIDLEMWVNLLVCKDDFSAQSRIVTDHLLTDDHEGI